MRFTRRTITFAGCTMLAVVATLLSFDFPVPTHADAQSGPLVTGQTMTKSELFVERSRARIEAILADPIPDIEFQQKPLKSVLVELKKLTGISMHFDEEELGDIIDPDVPITVHADAGSMTYKTLIEEFILGPNDLEIVIRDNFLIVMSYDKHLVDPAANELIIYNCRDLFVGIPVQPPAAEASDDPSIAGQGRELNTDIGDREQQLVNLVRMTIRREDSPWDDGGPVIIEYMQTIEAINGMLVVRARPEAHKQVRQLLRLLRQSTKEQEWPAHLGDWPHRPRAPLPQQQPGGGLGGGGGGFF